MVPGVAAVAGHGLTDDALREDGWLTRALGRPSFGVAARSGAAREAAERVAATPGAFAYAKVPCADVAVVGEMVDAGFRPVDVAVTLARRPPSAPPEPRLPVVEAEPRHRRAVLDVAGSAFTLTRFHLDPRIDDRAAARIKRDWAASCLDGKRGIGTLVALDGDGEVLGFLAVLALDRGGKAARSVDLIAVRGDVVRRGVGGALLDAFLQRHGPAADLLLVGTQAANVGSIALYEGRGFRTLETAYVLHLHHGGTS